jgi:hypothetical protein
MNQTTKYNPLWDCSDEELLSELIRRHTKTEITLFGTSTQTLGLVLDDIADKLAKLEKSYYPSEQEIFVLMNNESLTREHAISQLIDFNSKNF